MGEGESLSIPQPLYFGSCMSLLPAEGLAPRESFQEAGSPGMQSCCIADALVVERVLFHPGNCNAEKSSPLCELGGVQNSGESDNAGTRERISWGLHPDQQHL